ncbi:MAG: hypothetical protein ACI9JN_001143 [Bacteroidia bacterium]|jgi:hypothetical protein
MKLIKNISYVLLFLSISIGQAIGANAAPHVDGEKLFVTTDRHFYTPGERLSFTVFVVDDSHILQTESTMIKVLLMDGKSKTIDSIVTHVKYGRFSYFFNLPQIGGMYKVKASTRWQLNDLKPKQFEKEIYIQEIIKRNFFIKQELEKTNYRGTDTVMSQVHIKSRGNEPLSGAMFSAFMIIDGEQAGVKHGKLNGSGKANVSFVLPNKRIESAYIKVQSSYQGQTEYAMSRIPIQTNDISMVVYTEMGTSVLVDGVNNRLVVQSFDNLGNPKDINGYIEDQYGTVITTFESYHKGMAEVNFKPEFGFTYAAISDAAKNVVPLPPVVKNQPYVRVYEKGGSLIMSSQSPTATRVLVTLSGNGHVIMEKILDPQIGQMQVQVQTSLENLAPGVYGISFQSMSGMLYGRRLYVRRPDDVAITIKTNKELVSLGQNVKLSVNTAKESASFAVRVVSEQTLNQIKDRSHSIISWMYLGAELTNEIVEPKFYFDKHEVKSKKALELLSIVNHNSWRRDYKNGRVSQNKTNFYPRISGQIYGNVYQYYNQTNPIKGVKVRLKNTNYEVVVDSTGFFSLKGLPAEVLSNQPTLIISKGIERIEYPINQSYNFYNYSFSEPLNTEHFYTKEVKIQKKEIPAEGLQRLRYRNPIQLSTLNLRGNIRGEGVMAISPNSYSYSSTADLSTVSFEKVNVAYLWQFGVYNGYYNLWNEEYSNYTIPFGVALKYNNYRSNLATYPGPIKLNDKTTYWFGEASSDASGLCKLDFYVPMENDGFVIVCEGVTKSGKVFTQSKTIKVQDEVEIFTNVPKSLTAGDYAQVVLKCINHSDDVKRLHYRIDINGNIQQDTITLKGHETKPVMVELVTGNKQEAIQFQYTYGFDKNARNSPRHQIKILKKGHARNYVLAGNKSSERQKFKAEEVIDGTAEVRISIMNDFVELLESTSARMIRQPNGCFEQVSSSNYPNLLALKVLQKKRDFNQSGLISKIQMGYGKLAAYETPSHGFEWYGRNPPHTTLSAYGLLQFSLTRELGLAIDEKMFNRNVDWLLNQRDGKGGFKFHRGKYGFSSSDYETNNAYVTWVLSRISKRNLNDEIDAITSDVDSDFDAYKTALLAAAYANLGRTTEAQMRLDQLEQHFKKKEYKSFKTKGSIMYSGGTSLDVEIMAITLMAVHKLNATPGIFANTLISTIMKSQNQYGFGNTQSTALALEALSNYSDYFVSKNKEQRYTVWLDGKKILDYSMFVKQKRFATIVLNSDQLATGNHEIWVECQSDKQLPYTCEISWLEQIDKVEHEELVLDYTLSKNEVTQTDDILAEISITNKTSVDKPQTVAVVHIPAGTSFNMDELRLLKKEGVFDYFETKDDQLVFYFLGLKSNESKKVQFALQPNILGRFAPAESYVYQYYTPEIRSSVLAKPLVIREEVKQ